MNALWRALLDELASHFDYEENIDRDPELFHAYEAVVADSDAQETEE